MVVREHRQYAPEEKERISRGACPGAAKRDQTSSRETSISSAARPPAAREYWFNVRPTIAGMRRRVRQAGREVCPV